jgi:PHYB activation tagged suppressor 1
VWRVQKEIQSRLKGIIAGHAPSGANDLLGTLLAANRRELSDGSKKRLSLSAQEIIDNCKMFYLAGYETTATLLTWTMMLLAVNPEWQERTRDEALGAAPSDGAWSYESLHNLKLVSAAADSSPNFPSFPIF